MYVLLHCNVLVGIWILMPYPSHRVTSGQFTIGKRNELLSSVIALSTLAAVVAWPRYDDLKFVQGISRVLKINGLAAEDIDLLYVSFIMHNYSFFVIYWQAQKRKKKKRANLSDTIVYFFTCECMFFFDVYVWLSVSVCYSDWGISVLYNSCTV